MEGIFAMANKNTLLALAYIRESDNPLKVFCNLILYCLNLIPTKELRHDELKIKMEENFGISIPHHIINSCVKKLMKDKSIEKLNCGAGYKLIESKFNIVDFEVSQKNIEYSEKLLLEELMAFVLKNYNMHWNRDEAYKHLSDLILNDKTATDIVEDTFNDNLEKDSEHIHPTWYVKKYVIELLEKGEGSSFKYFIDVFNGMLVLNGLLQTNDYNQDKNQKFKGTIFYLDTKILLRILGFSFPYLCETAMELVELIVKEYGGKIGVFRHVISEIKSAINYAERDMRNKEYIENLEFDFFQKSRQYQAEDFKIAKDSVEDRIKNEFGFFIVEDIEWNDKKTITNNIDSEKMAEFLKKNNPKWKSGTINNDIRAILLTNIQRESNYSIYFGGKKKLPVFVTSNSKLVFDIKKYTDESYECDLPWSVGKMPLITDNNLMCRLWLTSKCKKDISLKLAKTAFLFQQSDTAFFERIKKTYNAVKEKHNYNLVDLDYERFERLKETIIDKTNGDLNSIDENVVALSFEELANRESIEKDKKIDEMVKERNSATQGMNDYQNDYVDMSANNHSNKVNLIKKFIWHVVNNLPLIVAVVGIVITYIIDYNLTNEFINLSKFYILIPIMIYILFEVFDKKILSDSIMDVLRERYIQYCVADYRRMVINELSEKEKRHLEAITEMSIAKTEFFNSKKKYM